LVSGHRFGWEQYQRGFDGCARPLRHLKKIKTQAHEGKKNVVARMIELAKAVPNEAGMKVFRYRFLGNWRAGYYRFGERVGGLFPQSARLEPVSSAHLAAAGLEKRPSS